MEKQLSKTQQDKLDELRRQLREGELTRRRGCRPAGNGNLCRPGRG